MNKVFNLFENCQNWGDENKNETDLNLFTNIQRYTSYENPLQLSFNNNPYHSQFNDYQGEQQYLFTQENLYPQHQNVQYTEQPYYTQHQNIYNSKEYQYTNKIETDFMKHISYSQEVNNVNFQQEEVIKKEENDQNNDQESQNDDNLSSTHSNYLNQNSSQIRVKIEENSQMIKQKEVSPRTTKKSKQTTSCKNTNNEKSKQSISKNNIRNFLTPIVRMKSNFIDYTLLEKEKVSTQAFDQFLKKHFYVQGQSRLNIRQTTFDSLLDVQDKTQMKEKKVFAQIVIKHIQSLFMKLIIEKSSNFNTQEFNQQFEWINGINESLIIFLNSVQSQN